MERRASRPRRYDPLPTVLPAGGRGEGRDQDGRPLPDYRRPRGRRAPTKEGCVMAEDRTLAEAVFFMDAIGRAALYVAIFVRITVPSMPWLFEFLLVPPLIGVLLRDGNVQRIYWAVLLLV